MENTLCSQRQGGGDDCSSNVDTTKPYDALAKIVVIGDGGIGKTSLITRFAEKSFAASYVATIGVDFRSKIINTNGKNLKLQIWDTAGQERFRNITQAYYRGAAGLLLGFSLTSQLSFESLEKWVQQIELSAPSDCCKILVGCKSDEQNRVVSRESVQALATKIGIKYLQSSAKTGYNVEEVFTELGQQILSRNQKSVTIGVGEEKTIVLSKITDTKQKETCQC